MNIPDSQFYKPIFSPWLGYGEFTEYYRRASGKTLVSPDRCWMLYTLCRQALFIEGEIWECGVYKGGTAAMLQEIIRNHAPYKRLRLFDTFMGMPDVNARMDIHQRGDFADTNLDMVREVVGDGANISFHQGVIPETFKGLSESRIAFAHVDVDIWQSVMDCCEFLYPRLSVGGFIVFDDYGFPTCPGARNAVDMYFSGREVLPLVLPTGQAIIFKSR